MENPIESNADVLANKAEILAVNPAHLLDAMQQLRQDGVPTALLREAMLVAGGVNAFEEFPVGKLRRLARAIVCIETAGADNWVSLTAPVRDRILRTGSRRVIDDAPFFASVYKFNAAAGMIDINPALNEFDAKAVGFYTGMQCEELAEKLEAIFPVTDDGVEDGLATAAIRSLEQLGERLKHNEYFSYVAKADREALLDADIDLQVVSEGAILVSGADGQGARREVNRANDDKVVDGKLQRHPETGKILKPEGWIAPDLSPFVCKSPVAV